MKTFDLICGSVFGALALYVLIAGLSFPEDQVMAIGPSYFPNLLAGGLLFSSLALIGRALKGKSRGSAAGLSFRDRGFRRLLFGILVAVLFTLLIKPLGFVLDAVLAVALYLLLLDVRKPLLLVSVPLLTTLGVYIVFEKFLSISLPTGIFGGLF